MRPLLFVNWRRVNRRFTALMWLVACVLALVVLIAVAGTVRPSAAAVHPSSHPVSGRMLHATP